MSDVTRILALVQDGDPSAADELFRLVYAELRSLAAAQLARERPGQTLVATALVHEAFVRLAGDVAAASFANRRHFFAAASEVMRRILIEAARRKQAEKHGGGLARGEVSWDEVPGQREAEPAEMLAIHELLDRLAAEHPRRAEVVKLRYFVGCTFAEIGQILQISDDAARDDWVYARSWLKRAWSRGDVESA